MHLYKITNKLNGKIYIGMTTRENAYKRWHEHVSMSKYSPRPNYIAKAIKKHGSENFSFEIVKSFNDISVNELIQEETDLIIAENSLAPNGYNLRLKGIFTVKTEVLSQKISKARQGKTNLKIKSSGYLGVSNANGQISASITHLRKRIISFFFSDEISAAKAYDMLAIHFFGREAKTNFPEKNYSNEDVEQNLIKFSTKNTNYYTSRHKSIYFCKSKKQWIVQINHKYITSAKTEEKALEELERFIKNPEDYKPIMSDLYSKAEKDLETVLKHRLEGKSIEEISEITGLKYSRVYNLLYRKARHSL